MAQFTPQIFVAIVFMKTLMAARIRWRRGRAARASYHQDVAHSLVTTLYTILLILSMIILH